MILFLATLAALGVWLLILSKRQRRRVEAHQALLAGLVPGDRVMTASGMFGTVRSITTTRCELEIAPGVVVELLPGAIHRRAEEPAGPEVDAAASGRGAALADRSEPDGPDGPTGPAGIAS